MNRRILYIIYRKLRPPLGLPFGLILLYGMFSNNLHVPLLLAATGFFLLETYGNLYNDYWDYEEDVRNGRKDKLTTCNILSLNGTRNLSLVIAAGALLLLLLTSTVTLIVGLYYSVLLVCYSHPLVRLKGSVLGYALLASAFLLLPFALGSPAGFGMPLQGALFSIFFFSQFMYILCQKDSTDKRDTKNLFIGHGWSRPFHITAFFAVISSASLLLISAGELFFLAIWSMNILMKIFNLNGIRTRTITRARRQRLVLGEFITPYLYLVGGLIA